jgi:hypothetical protein
VSTPAGGGGDVESICRTLDFGVAADLASRSKELSFESSSLTEVREASTSGFDSERHLSNEQLDVGIHCSEMLLAAGEVVVGVQHEHGRSQEGGI